MLKGISPIITPELLKTLAEMGHGDELVIGDRNFPAQSMGKRCLRLDGHSGTEVLDAILALFPLDAFVEAPVSLMEPTPGTFDGEPPIWRNSRLLSPSMIPRPSAAMLSALPSMTARRKRMRRFLPAKRPPTDALSSRRAACKKTKTGLQGEWKTSIAREAFAFKLLCAHDDFERFVPNGSMRGRRVRRLPAVSGMHAGPRFAGVYAPVKVRIQAAQKG